MQKSPYYLAIGFIAITITRVALFAALGLQTGVLGYIFGMVVGAWVYVATYWIAREETRWPALVNAAFAVATDLFFNEFELIRTLSSQQMIATGSNFMGVNQEYLRYGMQMSALVFGAIPTLAAALLGWLQSNIAKVKELNKPGGWERTVNAFFRVFSGLGVAIAVKVEGLAVKMPAVSGNNSLQIPANNQGGNPNGSIARWEDLSAIQRAEIAGKLQAAGNDRIALNALMSFIISNYGGSDRRARMWLQWIRTGKQ